MGEAQNTGIYDFIIVGSGFGGSISAMRLAKKGYKVAVLEQGKRYRSQDFPKTNWNLPKFFWIPWLRFFGIQQISILKEVMVLHGAGVGGGSLVYANTLMRPKDFVLQSADWPQGIDWQKELSPKYALAEKMLGATENPFLGEADLALKELAREFGKEKDFHPTNVGVYFGESGKTVPDPYFGGEGPSRTGCVFCGNCMVGCRFGSKNTLDQNYLYLAEKAGAVVIPQMRVGKITPYADHYEVETQNLAKIFSGKKTLRARRVILAAGVLGTCDLLFKNKEIYKTLPNISETLGEKVRTNGESLCGATTFEKHRNLSRGIAIGSAFHIDEHTKIEAVRYGVRNDAMRMLAAPLTDDGTAFTRPMKMIWQFIKRFPQMTRLITVSDWAKSSVILLVMQSRDLKMRLKLKRNIFGIKTVQGVSQDQIPSFIPVAQEASKKLAKIIKGEPENVISEVVLGVPATAHILGGACLGSDSNHGVIDKNHEVFGHKNLYICDGSVIPVNLGVNPSLTISALAERFTDQF